LGTIACTRFGNFGSIAEISKSVFGLIIPVGMIHTAGLGSGCTSLVEYNVTRALIWFGTTKGSTKNNCGPASTIKVGNGALAAQLPGWSR
jgi:hypothetical protein